MSYQTDSWELLTLLNTSYHSNISTTISTTFFSPPETIISGSTEEWTNRQVTLIIVLGLISLVTIFANLFVLYIFIVGKQRLRNPTNLLLANLAVADFLVGLFVMPILTAAVVLNGAWIFGDFICLTFDYAHFLLCGASMWSMIGIGIDRYIGVTHPLQYKNIITRNRTICVVILIWFGALCLTSGPLTFWPKTMSGVSTFCILNLRKHFLLFIIFVAYWIPITGTVIIYYLVYRNAVIPYNKHLKKSSASKQKSDLLAKQKLKQTRLAKNIAFVTGAIFAFYAPVFIAFTIKAFELPYFSFDMLMLTGWIRYCCSTVNPFMYALAVPGYKQEIKERLFGIRKRGNNLDESLTQSYFTEEGDNGNQVKSYDEKENNSEKPITRTTDKSHRFCTQCGYLMTDFVANINARCDKCHEQVLCSSWTLPESWGNPTYFMCPKCPTIRYFDGIKACFCQNCNHKFAPSEFRPPQDKLASLTTIAAKPPQQICKAEIGKSEILLENKSEIQQNNQRPKEMNIYEKVKVIERLRSSVIVPLIEQQRKSMMFPSRNVDPGAFSNRNDKSSVDSISLEELEEMVAQLEQTFGILPLQDKNN